MRSWTISTVLTAGLTGCGLGGAGGGSGAPAPALVFSDVLHEVGRAPGKIQLADMDCDGRLDVVAHCPGDSSIVVEKRPPVRNIGSSGQDGVEVKLRTLVPDSALDYCVADFDVDGLPDVAVIAGAPDFAVYLYVGDKKAPGALRLSTNFYVGPNYDRVAAGDMDGDGLPDVVCLSQPTGEITVQANVRKAPGTFTPGAPIAPRGAACAGLEVVDLFHDGALDVLTRLVGRDVLVIYDQNAAREVKQKQWSPANYRFSGAFATGDVTGDGLLDVVIASDTQTCVLEQDPTAPEGFHQSPACSIPAGASGERVIAVALGDLRRTGRLDLVTRTTNAAKVQAITCRFSKLSSPTRFDDDPTVVERRLPVHNLGSSGQDGVDVRIADGDGDGYLDVFADVPDLDAVAELRRVGLPPGEPDFGVLARVPGALGSVWLDVVTGDLDGDGRLDLATCGLDGVIVRFQDAGSPMTFHETSFPAAAGARDLVAADVDGDGRLDLAFATSDTFGVLWHATTGPEAFDAPTVLSAGGECRGIAVADLDRDGRPDLVTTVGQGGSGATLCAFQGSTARSFAVIVANTGSPRCDGVAIADLDCDGQVDIACTSDAQDVLTVSRHAPGLTPPAASFPGPLTQLPLAGGVRVAVGDVNGDGVPDLVTVDALGATVTYGDPTSASGFAPAMKLEFDVPVSGTVDLALADLDRDGDLDVVALCGDADHDAFRIVRGDAGSTAGFKRTIVIPHVLETSGRALALGDLDGDGWQDVVTISTDSSVPSTSTLTIWRQRPGPR